MPNSQLLNTPQLRVYRGPEEETVEPFQAEEDLVTISVGEMLPLIIDAIASERTWLTDFENDDITITRDLYEVLSAYQYFRRPSA